MNTSTALHLISLLDLTSLNATDTPEVIGSLCDRAANPLKSVPFDLVLQHNPEIAGSLENEWHSTKVAAVCVYPVLIESAIHALHNLDCDSIHIASVAGGFPSGMTPITARLREIEYAVQAGAHEIDTVINRSLLRQGLDDKVVDEIVQMKEACGDAHLKVILETGELRSTDEIYTASRLAIKAGADFIKTSTGKVTPAATPEAFEVMMHAIVDEYIETGKIIGCKPAGGIRTADEALSYVNSARRILTGRISDGFASEYLSATYFRIGASSLLDDIVSTMRSNLSRS